jgi:hypothetical protein
VCRVRVAARESAQADVKNAPKRALLRIDAFELPKFDRPGHWATGQRAEQHKTLQAGKVKMIGVIDDHTGSRPARSMAQAACGPSCRNRRYLRPFVWRSGTGIAGVPEWALAAAGNASTGPAEES